MRRNFKAASHLGHTVGCTTSILWWSYGVTVDPQIQVSLEQLSSWIDVWHSADTPMRARVRRAWKTTMPNIMKSQSRWQQARGFMTATIVTVAELGWRPASPSHWRVDESTMAVVDELKYAKPQVLERALSDLTRILAKSAAEHPQGRGIERGINFEGARKARRQLIREGLPMAVVALDQIVVGALRDPEVDPEAPPPETRTPPSPMRMQRRCHSKA